MEGQGGSLIMLYSVLIGTMTDEPRSDGLKEIWTLLSRHPDCLLESTLYSSSD